MYCHPYPQLRLLMTGLVAVGLEGTVSLANIHILCLDKGIGHVRSCMDQLL
jgi:hypothetical protein